MAACLLGVPQANAGGEPSRVAAPGSSLIGFATNTFWLPQKEGYSYLSRLRAGEISWIREDFNWALLEPQRGRYVWTATDALMRNASLLGIHVLATAAYSPGWASRPPPGAACSPYGGGRSRRASPCPPCRFPWT